MRSGVPLIATDIYSHTQTLDSEISHLVAPTVTGLSEGMLRLMEDRAYAQALALAAVRRAEASYSDRIYVEKVADFYRQVPITGGTTDHGATVNLSNRAR